MAVQCLNCRAINLDDAKDCISCGADLQTHFNPLHLPPGTNLADGKYEINKTIGEGGFAITYQGINTITSQIIAIKERWPAKNGNRQGKKVVWGIFGQKNYQEALRKFRLEADLLKKCTHECIVTHYDYFEENNTCYIVMPFIQGKTLYQLVEQKGVLPESQVKRYFFQLAAALKEVHTQGILHRDIKPDNIMIDAKEDKAILIDFGIAREFDENETEVFTVAFSHGYAPLEQYASTAKRTASADLYSLCASIYYAITNQPPAKAVDRLEVIRNKNIDSLVAPTQINANISPEFEKIILTGMEMEVKKRFQNASQLIQFLTASPSPNFNPSPNPNLNTNISPNIKASPSPNLNTNLRSNFKKSFIPNKLIDAKNCVNQAQGQKDKLEEAVKKYEEFLNSNQDDFNVLIELAQVLIHLDRIDHAKVYAEKAHQQQPNDGNVNGVLGLISCRERQWQQAVKYLEQAVKETPEKFWIHSNLAWALGKTGNWQQAKIVLEDAVNLSGTQVDSDFAFAQGLQSWVAANQEDWKATIGAAKTATAKAKSTNFRNAQDLQSWVYPCLTVAIDKHLISSYQDLSHCLDEFSQQVPDSAFAEGYKGWQIAKQGHRQEAISIFERATTKNNVPRWVLLNLAILYEQNHDIPNAIKLYEDYLNRFPDDGFALFRLGTLLGKQGHWERAIEMVEKAANLNWNYRAEDFQHTLSTYIY